MAGIEAGPCTKIPVLLEAGDQTIELAGLHEELEYLLENIKDNANYGEEMEEKVKRVFL